MDEIIKDERFKHIANDSRFKTMRKKDRKFKVDTRFKKMFSDTNFKLKYSVDKRGRPVNLTSNDNLKKFYELSSESENEKDQDKNEDKVIKNKNKTVEKNESDESDDEEDSKDEDDEKTDTESDEESVKSESSEDSSSDDDSDSDGSVHENEAIEWNELDKDARRSDQISSRLAVCNMDWDRIKANDLFVLLNSFKSADGVIKSVKIYISDFGKERIAYEKLHGPAELKETKSVRINNGFKKSENIEEKEGKNQNENKDDENYEDNDDDDDRNGDDQEFGSNFNRYKLRQYQFNRLKYYYAIVECDSAETANKIYTECDGNEYESSCTRLDLRFVPDDTEFADEDMTQNCSEAPDPTTFKPNLFVTTALNQTKVECTWDETPRERLALTMKNYTEDDIKKSNFKNILATSSEEEEDDDEEVEKEEKIKNVVPEVKKDTDDSPSKKSSNKKATKNDSESDRIKLYRDLLLNSDSKSKKKRDGDLEFSWEGGMEEEGFNSLLFDSKKKNDKKSNKPEKNIELNKEELKEQAQLSLMTMDIDENKAHFNLDELINDKSGKKSKKNKGKRGNADDENINGAQKVDDFKLNVNDPRFEALYVDHNFNIDPSNQSFKKTNAMETLVQEKLKRKLDDKNTETNVNNYDAENENSFATKKEKSSADISLMIKAIKSKTDVLKKNKNENKLLKTKK